jgi:hypothetical protein
LLCDPVCDQGHEKVIKTIKEPYKEILIGFIREYAVDLTPLSGALATSLGFVQFLPTDIGLPP